MRSQPLCPGEDLFENRAAELEGGQLAGIESRNRGSEVTLHIGILPGRG